MLETKLMRQQPTSAAWREFTMAFVDIGAFEVQQGEKLLELNVGLGLSISPAIARTELSISELEPNRGLPASFTR